MTEIPPLPNPATAGDLIQHYITLRDMVGEVKKEHQKELAPFTDRMNKLEAVFQKLMTDNNLENLKTDGGTAYKSEQDSVKVEDWDMYLAWVRENEAWHFLEQRATKASVKELLESEGTLPPGVSRKSSIKINVRRS